jgi:hypothetical protein
MTKISKLDLYWMVPLSLALGAIFAFLQPGSWVVGWLGFSFLFLVCFFLLLLSFRGSGGGKKLAWLVALAFGLRFIGGVATYLALPVNGFQDADDKAGFVYTDAHRRDMEAWDLAVSENSLFGGFTNRYAYDQYGGLITWSAFVYRYISPDAHRPLLLVLLSSFIAALGLPFLWRAASLLLGEKVASASGWIYALYPESILLGGSAMREPYLMAFSAFALWGFVDWHEAHNKRSLIWLGLGLLGMLLVSPAVALVSILIFAGWMYFTGERVRVQWWMVAALGIVFVLGLFVLSSALNRSGEFDSSSPLHVISGWWNKAVQWDVYQLERGSGWVQKLFDEMPEWLRLPFVMAYGLFQPVLPAALVEPTTLTWRVIGVLRAVGWYVLLPVLIMSFVAASSDGVEKRRRLFLWLAFAVWGWILFASLRGGGDQWDNPRYRTILFLWEAILAGYVWSRQQETHNPWLWRVVAMEVVFLLLFGQWYASRYFHLGGQLGFLSMVAIILVLWVAILAFGIWRDRTTRTGHGV